MDDLALWLMIEQAPGGVYLDESGTMTIAIAELPDGRTLKAIGPGSGVAKELYKTLFLERREGRLY